MQKFILIILILFSCLLYIPSLTTKSFAWSDYTFNATNLTWNSTTHEFKFDIINPSAPITLPIYEIILRDPQTGNIPYKIDFSNPNNSDCNNWTTCDYFLNGPGGDISNVQIIIIQLEQSGPNWVSQTINLSNNSSLDLPVPLVKQTSNPWQSQEYDSAHIWYPSDLTINAWGCAMTSAVMILQYHGIYTIPGTNFEALNPGTLNDWLNSQPDGYVGTGWINWLAISRLSKLAADNHIISSFDALEYTRTSEADKTQLTNDLNNNIPDILEEPGHFIVAKGINGSTFDINDPYFNLDTLDNTRYNNSFLSLGRFVTSMTDLSYIMLTSDPNVTLTIKDNQGNIVGSSFIQSPLIDPVDGTTTNSPLKIYYVPQPDSGIYTITETNTFGQFQFNSYLYDRQGNPHIQTINGSGNATYTIQFDKNNSNNSIVKNMITFDSTLHDITNAQDNKLINNGLATSLSEYIKNAEKFAETNPDTAKVLLNNGIRQLN